jgi:hypothetical protein
MSVWKLKLPLKTKIFMWYLKRGVVLTKDNLIRRNWKGSKTCAFCSHPETIQHLFFDCHVAKFIWRAVQTAFNIDIPISVMHLFNDWANGMGPHMRKGLLTGAAALCWAMWTSRNDIVFDNAPTKTCMQVLYRGTHWLRYWAQLQRREEESTTLKDACRSLESMVMSIFVFHGWRFWNRIQS